MFARLVRAHVFTLAMLSGLLIAARVQAQRSLDIDPSVISAGMGGASSAVVWGAEPNYWANPALLGYYDGLRWQWSNTRLIPELAPDVKFTTKRATLAYWGIGIETAGSPFSAPGGLRLDYGQSQGTDPSGNPTGTFDAFENVEALGIGVSLANLAGSLLAKNSEELPEIAKHFDIALGYAYKHADVDLGPGLYRLSFRQHDRGLLLRGGVGAGVPGGTRILLDGSYGRAELSYDGGTPSPGTTRNGFAARLAIQHPFASASTGSWFHRSLMRAIQPLAAVTLATDHEVVAAGFIPGSTLDHQGAELTMLNVLSMRVGHIEDRANYIDGGTFGLGVALPIGDFAGVRYDYGQVPHAQGSGLKDQQRHSYSIFMNPLAMRREMR
jgi:hypothetical protein